MTSAKKKTQQRNRIRLEQGVGMLGQVGREGSSLMTFELRPEQRERDSHVNILRRAEPDRGQR